MSWFTEAKFGMFIHWGAYSVTERGEWTYNREMIPREEYIEKYVNNFKAENYDPDEWARIAKDAGMKYMVLTTRHHDGFALWDTKTSDYNSVNMGPKKDLVRPYVEAVRRAGLKVGLYFSPADWQHPDYPGGYRRDWPPRWDNEETRLKYIEYYTAQLEELCNNYGKIDLLWYDGAVPRPLDGHIVNEKVRKWQPGIIINNRNGEPYDFTCSEQEITSPKENIPWEACMTLNNNWGYHAGDIDYKSPKEVIRLMLTAARDGGNLLLNVGPKASGEIPQESVDILKKVGEWMRKNGEAVYGAERCNLNWIHSAIMTAKGDNLYINLICHMKELWIAEIKNEIKEIKVLSTGKKLEFEKLDNGRIHIKNIPEFSRDDMVLTLACKVEGNVQMRHELVKVFTGMN